MSNATDTRCAVTGAVASSNGSFEPKSGPNSSPQISAQSRTLGGFTLPVRAPHCAATNIQCLVRDRVCAGFRIVRALHAGQYGMLQGPFNIQMSGKESLVSSCTKGFSSSALLLPYATRHIEGSQASLYQQSGIGSTYSCGLHMTPASCRSLPEHAMFKRNAADSADMHV